MASGKIAGARLIGGTWHSASESRSACGMLLPEFKRGSMRTKDPSEARRMVRAMLAELDALQAQLDSAANRLWRFDRLTPGEKKDVVSEADQNVAALPHDYRQLVDAAGGVFDAGQAMRGTRSLLPSSRQGGVRNTLSKTTSAKATTRRPPLSAFAEA
ncbi:hypothetical protein O4J55_26375 [Paracoccus sp. PXZ]